MKTFRKLTFHPTGRASCARGVLYALLTCLLLTTSAAGQSLTASNLNQVAFEQKLDSQVSTSLPFRDETGATVRLGDYLGRKPAILVLGYYECPMLCTLTLNGLTESLEDLKWTGGNQFEIIGVSIDPHETPALAAAKKATYLKRYGRAGAETGWHFLTGDNAAIETLAAQVGFHYAYDPAVKQYAHPSGVVILTPQGRVAKYLFGVTFSPTELSGALRGAAGEQIGSRIEQLVLLCFHYSPIKGRYGPAIMLAVRILGAITLAGLIGLLVSAWRAKPSQLPSTAAPSTNAAPPRSGSPVR